MSWMKMCRNYCTVMVIIAIVCSLRGISGEDLVHRRRERSLLDFSAMISCATSRSSWDYNGYGCWCGSGGSGTPVDSVDWCCYFHDKCYDRLVGRGCSQFGLYTTSYDYTCRPGPNPVITCDTSTTTCGRKLCECDRQAVLCFSNSGYNEDYRGYSQRNC